MIIVWFIFMCFIGWFTIGCIILIPFMNTIIKVDPTKHSYNAHQENLRQIITWPYMLYKIYKYRREHEQREN